MPLFITRSLPLYHTLALQWWNRIENFCQSFNFSVQSGSLQIAKKKTTWTGLQKSLSSVLKELHAAMNFRWVPSDITYLGIQSARHMMSKKGTISNKQ